MHLNKLPFTAPILWSMQVNNVEIKLQLRNPSYTKLSVSYTYVFAFSDNYLQIATGDNILFWDYKSQRA